MTAQVTVNFSREALQEELVPLIKKLERRINNENVTTHGVVVGIHGSMTGSQIFTTDLEMNTADTEEDRAQYAETAQGKYRLRAIATESWRFKVGVGFAGPGTRVGRVESIAHSAFGDSIALLTAATLKLAPLQSLINTARVYQLKDAAMILEGLK